MTTEHSVSERELQLGDEETVPRHRLVDRLSPRLVRALTVLGLGVPVVWYFWVLSRYGVNVIVGDQWSDVVVIDHSYVHLFDWSSLWAQHNENRIFFPNLTVIALSRLDHLNIRAEELLSALMLVASVALLIWAHKRRSSTVPWLYYSPVVVLAFSVVQYQNMLWGFQMAWYLVLLCFALVLFLIDRPQLTWIAFAISVVAATVGSFSSLEGLLIWPAGMVLLFFRRRRPIFWILWMIAAASTVIIYFYNFKIDAAFNPDTPDPHAYVLHHPTTAIRFFLFMVGDILGVRIPYRGPINNAVVLFGLLIVVLAVVTLIVHGARPGREDGGPIGVTLIVMGLLFAATVTFGRVSFGYWEASGSRYSTFDLLIPIGIYLVAIELPRVRSTRVARPIIGWMLAGVIVLQASLGLYFGLEGARDNHTSQTNAAHVLANIDHSSDTSVRTALYLFQSASYLRHEARIAKRRQLSLFAP